MTFLYDIINLQFVLILYFIAVYYLRLDALKSFLVLGHLIAIFLLNDVLFEPSYWSDQRRYLWSTMNIREQLFSLQGTSVGDVPKQWFASFIFAFLPVPFINSIQSIAMINFLLYLLSFVYLRKKGVSSNSIDFFFLLYPSFLLYSSLALRETLITFFMILGLHFLIVEEKRLTALIFTLPLAVIKIQNFLILVLTYVIYLFFKKGSMQRYLIFFGSGLLVIFFGNHIPIINVLFERIDYYRWNLIAENFGYNWNFMGGYDYQPFVSGFSIIPLVIKSFVYMLLKPFPWEVTNLVQLIQSVENIFIIALIVWVVKKKIFMPIIKRKLLFLNILLVLSMTIYGLVTFNFGTAARFRFPFIVIYLVFYFYLLKLDKLISKQLSKKFSSQHLSLHRLKIP
jgi:hypothetical protein